MTTRKVGREWTLHNDLHPQDMDFSVRGTAADDDIQVVVECLSHNQSITMDLDVPTALQIASEIFGRAGMSDRLLNCLVHEAVLMLKESDPEALKHFNAQLAEKVADDPGD